MGRKHNKTEKKKKAAEAEASRTANANSTRPRQYQGFSIHTIEEFMKMYEQRQRATNDSGHNHASGSSRHSDHHYYHYPPNDNTKTWDIYIQEEVGIHIGMDQFQLLKEQMFIIPGIFLLLLLLDKIWCTLFGSQSHPNAISSVIYIICCTNTAILLSTRSLYDRTIASIVEKGLPAFRNAHHVYYHTRPHDLKPSVRRNPFYASSRRGNLWALIAQLRIWALKLLNKCSFLSSYLPFLFFWVLARRYDTFPTQWWTVALALGTFYTFLSSPNDYPSRIPSERELFIEFWEGMGLQILPVW